MGLDATAVGRRLPEAELTVERGRLRLFCAAIGETDPVYTDVDAARAAGYRDLPVPPTFLCAIQHERADPFDWLTAIGGDMDHVLHGEQEFTYHAMAYAGDHLTLTSTITDIYERKGGTLTFLVRQSSVHCGTVAVAELRDVIVVRGAAA